ncbi:hypothetical protein [Cognatilysobacter lacus]|uniref:Integron gene cassette protein n=1 Tax=Cognatilysobacter lacus TaxID=1643323 RepID=A0A5D8YW54_9GAMM|nr:hypothetical protein [Lysobacter lacus]TZF86965.1 hypothetical protein FW784_11760 [Lysobacter lacus]
MVTASDFRDKSIASLLVAYDWETSAHLAELTVRSGDGEQCCFRLVGLSEWSAYEDFAAQHIEQCTLVADTTGWYLSLDPHQEGLPSPQDNLWFRFASMEPGSGSNNSSKPTPLRGAA